MLSVPLVICMSHHFSVLRVYPDYSHYIFTKILGFL